jgi:hypothetical protein
VTGDISSALKYDILISLFYCGTPPEGALVSIVKLLSQDNHIQTHCISAAADIGLYIHELPCSPCYSHVNLSAICLNMTPRPRDASQHAFAFLPQTSGRLLLGSEEINLTNCQ